MNDRIKAAISEGRQKSRAGASMFSREPALAGSWLSRHPAAFPISIMYKARKTLKYIKKTWSLAKEPVIIYQEVYFSRYMKYGIKCPIFAV
ncbi:hypothetical protein [Oceanibaculum sp.]|uniref:hypothetical protein n=1 Tax=Oceanibaculum sp. TaxID=1903597 RepID=UPI00258F142B|nr:hypothetical protein [Oceanibaculum sp.]MCH2393222.1 hypothetical protein [Oceanibaculum sp.]